MGRQKKPLVVMIIFSLILGLFPQIHVFADETNLAEVDYVGPGLFETDLIVSDGGAVRNNSYSVGTTSIWNSRNELFVTLETNEEWLIEEVFMYIGNYDIPTSEGGNPMIKAFPFIEQLDEQATTYERSFKLVDELDMSWGMRDEHKRIPKIAICAKLMSTADGDNSQYFAWADGHYNFDVNTGKYFRYAVVHPKTGHFIDAPVGGLNYQTPTQWGKTDDGGAFEYIEGEDVNLSLGSVVLGTTRAKHKVTPMDLFNTTSIDHEAVGNMAMLLQSFDNNGEPHSGITIEEETIDAFEQSLDDLAITTLDFYDTETIQSVLGLTNEKLGGSLNIVSKDEAKENLEKGTNSTIVRKNISKSGDYLNTKAKLELMPVYVPAQKANGDPVTLEFYETTEDETSGEIVETLIETRDMAKPLVSVYTEEIGDTGADDVIAAVSRDEGETWKTMNLSKSADKSSFKLANGIDFPGDVHKPQVKVRGNYILAVWTSKFARTGNPTYAIKLDDEKLTDDEYYEEDIWGVSGPQRSLDYSDLGFPEVGELPFSVVWVARGLIVPETGEVVWYKPERLTSGRRDANQIMMNGFEDVGFAVVWQEDPEGLRPGEQAGPGEGWSGATTNHKTDIWYSYIPWEDFATEDPDFVPKGASQTKEVEEDEEEKGRPKALVPFKLPVRISDNDTLNVDNMKVQLPEDVNLPTVESGVVDVDPSTFVPLLDEEKLKGTHQYGYVDLNDYYSYYNGPTITDQLYYKINNQNADKYVSITSDGRIMDGNTGASRPNIMMQRYQKPDGTFSAWVEICYEETKGVGSGPPPEEEVSVNDAEDSQGVGSQRGKYSYVCDEGKNVIYHTFDFYQPDLVSAGEIMNPQVVIDSEEAYEFYKRADGTLPGILDDEGNTSDRGLLYLTNEDGSLRLDWDGSPMPAYENARRPRMIIQGKKSAVDAVKGTDEKATVMVMVYKMGEEGKGRPSDIFMRRWIIAQDAKGNPYAVKNLSPITYNISSVTVGDTMVNDNRSEDSKGEGTKVLNWEQTIDNLSDRSWTNPYDDARAHRGILKGNQLAIALDWTPNWAAARNGNDKYDLYIRRSFDGGLSFTPNPAGSGVTHTQIFKTGLGTGEGSDERTEDLKAIVETTYAPGEFEPMRNVSLLQNNKKSVIEPRLVGGPGTLPKWENLDGELIQYDVDIRDINTYWVTYGTSTNPSKNSDELKEPLDLYYSYTNDFGDTYFEITKVTNPESKGNNPGQEKIVWDWLAKDTGQKVAAQAECQIRMPSDGSILYAVWNETNDSSSDVMFRRIIPGDLQIKSVIDPVDTVAPLIQIIGVEDGDVISEDVMIDVKLSEPGTWEAIVTSGNDETIYTEAFTIEPQHYPKDYTLEVIAEDMKGNKNARKLGFTVDGRVPRINISGVKNNETTAEDIQLIIFTTGKEETITLTKDGQLIESNGYDQLSEEGIYKLAVTASANGFEAEEHMTFVIDKTPPVINFKGVVNDASYEDDVKPEVVVTDNLSNTLKSLSIQLNELDFLSSTKITQVGDYTLTVTAEDQAGNIAESSVDFEVVNRVIRRDNDDKDDEQSQSQKNNSQVITQPTVPTAVLNLDNIIRAGVDETIVIDEQIFMNVPKGTFAEDVYYDIHKVEDTTDQNNKDILANVYEIYILNSDGGIITQFGNDIEIAFPFDMDSLPEDLTLDEVKIGYWDSSVGTGRWIALPSQMDETNNLIKTNVDHLSQYSVIAFRGFPSLEDCSGHWGERQIYRMVSLGIVCGDETGYFRPDATMSKEEMAKILVESLELTMGEMVDINDLNEVSDWAQRYVFIAVSANAMALDDQNNFNPKEEALREQLIFAAHNHFKLNTDGTVKADFKDEKEIAEGYRETVRHMVQNRLITGYPDGTIKLQNSITRSEMMKVISQYLGLEND